MSFSNEVREELKSRNDSGGYLREAFIKWGTIADPRKEYDLEFTPPGKEDADKLMARLKAKNFLPKLTLRKGKLVIYLKDNGNILDFLTTIGATKSMFKLLDIKIEKEARGDANRRTNCDNANMNRLAYAAASQLANINIIDSVRGLNSLPLSLRSVAKLRQENPEASLSELCRLSEKKLSRSGLNHRLQKINAIAEEITKQK
ncbi:MAG: DNA-binding protein WhiA [Oscillospiraceae bacterium]|nr:DNA-binding protein WhiA [Oscillospiraceae bacterium]